MHILGFLHVKFTSHSNNATDSGNIKIGGWPGNVISLKAINSITSRFIY